MAKVRNSAHTMRSGRIGENTWYVRNGEQIVRQRLQNSNYGEGARRSEAQQLRRSKWGNLVNFYKAIKSWQPKAYEGLKPGQTDYNLFMSLNANSTPVYLTRQLVEAGGAVADEFKVSKGSLPALTIDASEVNYDVLLIQQHATAITSSSTIGQLSTSLIDASSDYKEGDNLAFIFVSCQADSAGVPRSVCIYKEITLDKSSSALITSTGISAIHDADGSVTNFNLADDNFNVDLVAIIHTRLEAGGLKVSSQSLLTRTDYSLNETYSTPAAAAAAVDSYGVDADVPLMPGE